MEVRRKSARLPATSVLCTYTEPARIGHTVNWNKDLDFAVTASPEPVLYSAWRWCKGLTHAKNIAGGMRHGSRALPERFAGYRPEPADG
jgi:hypothetical protein